MKRIYVLHEYGAEAHYNGLLQLCKTNNIELVFREFRFLHLIGSGIEHRQIRRILKQPINVFFLLNLLFTKGKRIVLGMHPYDKRLPILSFILRNHVVYYHSSYTTWFPYEMEKTKKTSKAKQNRIKLFINRQVKHVFAVTRKASESISAFTGVSEEKLSVVYHSYKNKLSMGPTPPLNNYIYVGRMDVQKGIEEMCKYFANHRELSLTLIGDGDNIDYIRKMNLAYTNINYIGYVKGLDRLKDYYNKNAFFLLNSQKTKEWEELFGQVIIEAMSCGCVPIAVNHSGPKEIITNGINGFLFEEGNLASMIDFIQMLDPQKYSEIRNKSFQRGHDFECEKIAYRWLPVLE